MESERNSSVETSQRVCNLSPIVWCSRLPHSAYLKQECVSTRICVCVCVSFTYVLEKNPLGSADPCCHWRTFDKQQGLVRALSN